jgi:aminoglycoside 3-N-acetyltransferase I
MEQNKQYDVRRLTTDDTVTFKQLVELFCDVFDMQKDGIAESRLQQLLAAPHFVVLAAFENDKVCGGLTGYIMPMYYHTQSELYLYDMAVAATHQRQGIGRMLISAATAYCSVNNISTMFVEAHAEDQHAVEFYRNTGGVAEQAVHFNYRIQ